MKLPRHAGNLLIILFILSGNCKLYCQQADSVSSKNSNNTGFLKPVIIPAALIGYGISSIGNNGLYSSADAKSAIQSNFGGFHTRLDDYTVLAPAAAVYILHLAGVKGKNSFTDKTLMFAASGALTGITVLSLKQITNIQRPDGSTFNSLPSGHTAFAFTSAEFLHQEYKDVSVWYSIAGYSVATATGAMRMLNNRHWMSDVLIGAGIGMLSAKTTYAVYPLVKKKIIRHANTIFIPAYTNGQAGFAFVYRF